MNCACRTAALRIFVRSLAQLTLPKTGGSKLVHRCQSTIFRFSSSFASGYQGPRGLSWTSLSSRQLHFSSFHYGQSQAAVADASKDVAEENDSSDSARPTTHGTTSQTAERVADIPTPELKSKQTKRRRSKRSATTTAETRSKERTRKLRLPPPKPNDEIMMVEINTGNDVDPPPEKEQWQIQKKALQEKFPEGWNPRKKLSPDALDGIRALHAQYPGMFTTEALAKRFEVSPDAIRRILKSKWRPSSEEEESRQERWFSRGKKVWARWAELGKKPPRRWRREGIVRDPSWNRPRRQPGDDEDIQTNSQGKRTRLSVQKKLAQHLV